MKSILPAKCFKCNNKRSLPRVIPEENGFYEIVCSNCKSVTMRIITHLNSIEYVASCYFCKSVESKEVLIPFLMPGGYTRVFCKKCGRELFRFVEKRKKEEKK